MTGHCQKKSREMVRFTALSASASASATATATATKGLDGEVEGEGAYLGRRAELGDGAIEHVDVVEKVDRCDC